MNLPKKRKSMIFLVIIVSGIMTSMLATALTTALPAIMEDLNITAARGQWLTSLYSLVMGIFVLCTAFLSSRFPTKKLYVGALTLFIVGLLIDLLAPTFLIMMVGRVFQAAGNGVLTAVAQVILLTIYPLEDRGKIMGMYGLAMTVAPIFAPTLAGLIVDIWNWRMIFALSFVICIIALIFSFIFFSNVLENKPVRIDFLSVVLCAAAFTGITLGAGNLGVSPFLSFQAGGALAIGVVTGVFFVLRQLKLTTPFLNIRVFRNIQFRMAVIGSMAMYLIMMAATLLYPLQLQTVCGYSATVSALVNMPASAAMAFLTPLVGQLYNRIGPRILFIFGSTMLLINAIAFALFTVDTPLLTICIFTVIRCVGISCIMMPMVTYSVTTLPKEDIPSASSLLTSLRTVAGSIGSAVFVAIATAASRGSLDMGGINVAYQIMAIISVGLVLLGIFGIKVVRKHNIY